MHELADRAGDGREVVERDNAPAAENLPAKPCVPQHCGMGVLAVDEADVGSLKVSRRDLVGAELDRLELRHVRTWDGREEVEHLLRAVVRIGRETSRPEGIVGLPFGARIDGDDPPAPLVRNERLKRASFVRADLEVGELSEPVRDGRVESKEAAAIGVGGLGLDMVEKARVERVQAIPKHGPERSEAGCDAFGVEPLVSFCIRGWRASTVAEAIESALAQTIKRIEVVVTDDMGNLEPVVRAFDDPRVSYHRNTERLGPSWNAREALNLGRGQFLFLLNDDDRLLPTYAERALERFSEVPRAGIVFTNVFIERDGERWLREVPISDGTYDDFLPEFVRAYWLASGPALLRREVWEEGERAHPIPGGTAADSFIAFRAAFMDVVFSYVDEPLLVWTIHPETISANPELPDLHVSLWSSFELADPELERIRVGNLAETFVRRAVARLRESRYAEAREDLSAARALGRRAPVHSLFANLRLPIGPALAVKHRIERWRS